jgi:hypothetical protein
VKSHDEEGVPSNQQQLIFSEKQLEYGKIHQDFSEGFNAALRTAPEKTSSLISFSR